MNSFWTLIFRQFDRWFAVVDHWSTTSIGSLSFVIEEFTEFFWMKLKRAAVFPSTDTASEHRLMNNVLIGYANLPVSFSKSVRLVFCANMPWKTVNATRIYSTSLTDEHCLALLLKLGVLVKKCSNVLYFFYQC